VGKTDRPFTRARYAPLPEDVPHMTIVIISIMIARRDIIKAACEVFIGALFYGWK
jgi:hypothetical protein